MEVITKIKDIYRFFDSGLIKQLADRLVDEYCLKIVLDGRDFMEVVVYPSQIEYYILGFFFTRGFIKSVSDIEAVQIDEGIVKVRRIAGLRDYWPEFDVLETTGSPNIKLKAGIPFSRGMINPAFKTIVPVIRNGVKRLSDMPVFRQTGGTHCAILYTKEGKEIIAAEDIGRHNSVDKVIGGGLSKGVDFSHCWLAVSGRLPSDMVMKPAMAGIPLVASISAPTASGVETAERTGLTLIGFSREGRFNCYSYPERIVQKA